MINKDLNEYKDNDLDKKMDEWWNQLDKMLDDWPSDTEKALIELCKELAAMDNIDEIKRD